MEIRQIVSMTSDVDALIQKSRQYQAQLYPAESIHQASSESLLGADMHLVGAYRDNCLLGLGGVKIVVAEPVYGEIKNLFVDPEYRRQGVSSRLMNALEGYLLERNITLCRLETGVCQPESIALYRRLGYLDSGVYGDYEPDPLSVYMEKCYSR